MTKKIVLLSDGTGNSAGKVWRTNVWRVFESLELKGSDQIAIYDDGVGTSSFKPLAILGGVFGYGLKRNVLNLYKFLSRNHVDGDRIYGFGFSRGAFTMRVVIGLVLNQGLVEFANEGELDSKARAAYRAYRHNKYSPWNLQYPFRLFQIWLDSFSYKPCRRPIEEIEFMGLWDTVAAYGLPIDEMTRGVNQWIWPLEPQDRKFNPAIKRARHALSIDDERATFHPVLWNEDETNTKPSGASRPTDPEQLLQVWFVGVHSNVGGGYPDDSLANVSLAWILAEAKRAGLTFKDFPGDDPDALVSVDSAKDKDGRLYDSRSGLGGYYRYSPRKISDLYDAMPYSRDRLRDPTKPPALLPKIHETVFGRIKMGAHVYAPIGFPEDYEVVESGDVTVNPKTFIGEAAPSTINPNNPAVAEGPDAALSRHAEQQGVWNAVWRRRAIYFLTVFASAFLLMYPLYRDSYSFEESRTRLRIVSDTIRLLGTFLPSSGVVSGRRRARRLSDIRQHQPRWFHYGSHEADLDALSSRRQLGSEDSSAERRPRPRGPRNIRRDPAVSRVLPDFQGDRMAALAKASGRSRYRGDETHRTTRPLHHLGVPDILLSAGTGHSADTDLTTVPGRALRFQIWTGTGTFGGGNPVLRAGVRKSLLLQSHRQFWQCLHAVGGYRGGSEGEGRSGFFEDRQ